MKQTIANIRSAFKDNRKFANLTSNSGIVEFTHAVRKIAHDYYDELQIESGNGKFEDGWTQADWFDTYSEGIDFLKNKFPQWFSKHYKN